MRSTYLLLVAFSSAHADPPDPKLVPYEKLFTLAETFTLPCVVQHQVKLRYEPACTQASCATNGKLECTVKETKRLGNADLARLVCTRTDGNGRSSVRADQWYARTPQGMWIAGATAPTLAQLTVVLRARPWIAAKPVVGSIKKKQDPDGEDDRIDGSWINDHYCLDSSAGKSNSSWTRWCVSRANGIVGTFHTNAEAVAGERCGDPW
jgi:hypothetical protein